MAYAIATSHPREMNHTEELYQRYLDAREQVGEIRWSVFEPMKVRLADKTWYTVDFLVQAGDGVLEAHEVKTMWSTGKPGFEEDARVKIKVAAEAHPYMRFIVATYSKHGGWEFEELIKRREGPVPPTELEMISQALGLNHCARDWKEVQREIFSLRERVNGQHR